LVSVLTYASCSACSLEHPYQSNPPKSQPSPTLPPPPTPTALPPTPPSPKASLRDKFIARMQPQLLVSRGATRVIRKGAPPPVHISTEKRQGNKRVTKVTGLEAYLIDVEQCAAELRSKLACSTSVAELPGKNHPGHEVVCQGAVADKVADYLMSCHGVPKRLILAKT